MVMGPYGGERSCRLNKISQSTELYNKNIFAHDEPGVRGLPTALGFKDNTSL